MNTATRHSNDLTRGRADIVLLAFLVIVGALAAGHLWTMSAADGRPAASEFGLGPRASASGKYTATLVPAQPLEPRVMQTVVVRVVDEHGQGVDGARITVDGAMPQHGHGLPTRPRVTRSLGRGFYEIDGVRFNMGGWWELQLSVNAGAGTDLVTFNLDL